MKQDPLRLVSLKDTKDPSIITLFEMEWKNTIEIWWEVGRKE